MSAVNKVNFFLQAAAIFPPNGYVNKLLKSHYLATGREVAEQNVTLPKKEFGEKRMCQKCSSIWLDGNLKLRISSKRLKKPKQIKLAGKADAKDVYNRKQRSKAKWLEKNSQSRVDITCLLCKHKTKIHLEKPKNRIDSTSQSTATSTATQNNLQTSSSASSQKKPSKKKKKDKFAGLNPYLVAQASTSCSRGSTSNALAIINSTPSTSATINTTAAPTTTTTTKKSPNSATTPPSSAGSSSTNARKSDKKILPVSHSISKKTKRKKDLVVIPPRKEVSKTQKKNTLLQLAQLLKSSASLTNKRSNGLENLLR